MNSNTEWRVISVHNDGLLQRLGKETYERVEIYPHRDYAELAMQQLLNNPSVFSIRLSSRQVSAWEPEQTMIKHWKVEKDV